MKKEGGSESNGRKGGWEARKEEMGIRSDREGGRLEGVEERGEKGWME